MVKYKCLLPIWWLTMLCLIGCKPDFIELDLSKNSVKVLSPPDNHNTSVMAVKFWWEKMEGANGYRLQLASPGFDNIQEYLLDTSLTDNSFLYSLEPGNYQWQLNAFNGSSASLSVTYSLSIDSSIDLSLQTIALTSPVNNSVTSNMNITFKWSTLYNADDYTLEVASPDFNGPPSITPVVTINDSSAQIFTQEGQYQWRVKGQNNTSNTPYTTYSFEIDTTAPNTPLLISPIANAVLTDSTISFFWDRGIVTGSSIFDSLYVYSDSLMTSLMIRTGTSSTSYMDTLSNGSYFWRVSSWDAADNYSGYSVLNKFTIQ